MLRSYNQRNRVVVWHKDHQVENITIRESWVDLPVKQKQTPLFSNDISTLSNLDLDELIERASKEKFERLLRSRFIGADPAVSQPMMTALRSLGIADPVAYVHSDASCTFVTMTSTKEMPIKITIKSKDKEARTIDNIEHVTLHGLPVVATLKSAFED